MGGMCLKFMSVIGRCLIGHLSMFGPMAGTSGNHMELVHTFLLRGGSRGRGLNPAVDF